MIPDAERTELLRRAWKRELDSVLEVVRTASSDSLRKIAQERADELRKRLG